jgi:hypothetical protein
MILLVAYASSVGAHEMTPTYPKLKLASVDGLYKTTMNMFNKRADVEYYEIGVFDKDFNSIPFVSSYNITKIKYLGRVKFDVYIRSSDYNKAYYICSQSKLRKDTSTRTAISSKICSKFKK